MKKWWIGLVVLVSVGLVGCGNQGAKQAVEAVYAYNHETEPVDGLGYYDQKNSNAYVYEDQDNYYVLLIKKSHKFDSTSESVGRVGKHNQKVDFDYLPSEYAELYFVRQWYNQNKKPIYEEVHVDLSAYE